MKVAKIALMVCAAIVLAATYSPAGQYKVKVSGTVYSEANNNIVTMKLANKDIIGFLSITNKGAQLLYDTSGESNGTNLVIVADKCGNPLATIAVLKLNQATCITTTNATGGTKEQVCSVLVDFLGVGSGTVVTDIKTLVTTKGINLVGTSSGVFTLGTAPGVISITISGAFKPPTTGCP